MGSVKSTISQNTLAGSPGGYFADNERSPPSKNNQTLTLPNTKRKILRLNEIQNVQDLGGQSETEGETEIHKARNRAHKRLHSVQLSEYSTVQPSDVQTTTVSPQQSIKSSSTSLVNAQEILTAFALIIVLLYLIYCIYYLTLLKDIYKEDCGEDDDDEDNGAEQNGFKEVEMDFHNFIE